MIDICSFLCYYYKHKLVYANHFVLVISMLKQIKEVFMSIVIIGGNECMVCQYQDICKRFGCKAKVYAKKQGMLRKDLGNPDLLILFTNTASHKMVISASQEAKKKNIPISRIHTSSATALQNLLSSHCCMQP